MLLLKSQANPYNEHTGKKQWKKQFWKQNTVFKNSFPWPNSRNLSHFS